MGTQTEATVPENQFHDYNRTLGIARALSEHGIKQDPEAKIIKNLPKANPRTLKKYASKKVESLQIFDGAVLIHTKSGKRAKAVATGYNHRYSLEWTGSNKTSFAAESELETEFTRAEIL